MNSLNQSNPVDVNNADVSNELQSVNRKILELEKELDALKIRRDCLSQKKIEQKSVLLSVEQKVALFKKFFKGRDDVFATRWQNAQRRSGYSVACHNEWVAGICNKPKIKCSECPNRKHKPLNDEAIYNHLIGKQIVGLYPLLSDNSCYLLAADFDKEDWQEAVKAMSKVCDRYCIPHAIEISRSGNGAHLWIFFVDAVPARDARLLGFGLLDKAMEIHPNLSFESYDRLFPNQDIMPEGGFGNLIALPLQKQARKKGNSLFANGNLQPFEDQWSYLAHTKRVSTKQLNELITTLAPNDLELLAQNITDTRPPWEQGAKAKLEKIDNCPAEITITLANHIYFELDKMPAPLAARLKRLASFSNPVFFKKQAMRFSTHGIPRYITCARIEQGYLSLPRGCFDDALELLKEHEIVAKTDEKRELGKPLRNLKFLGKLRKDQSKAVSAMTKHSTGVLHAPTAFGKTVTAIGIIAKRKTNTLILTHSLQLLQQWQERLKVFLEETDIGVFGGGKKKPTGKIDIATYQSLINKKDNTIVPLVQVRPSAPM